MDNIEKVVTGDINFIEGKPIFVIDQEGSYRRGTCFGLTLYWKNTEPNPFDKIREQMIPTKKKCIGIWGQDLDESDKFAKSITKNAGQRDQ